MPRSASGAQARQRQSRTSLHTRQLYAIWNSDPRIALSLPLSSYEHERHQARLGEPITPPVTSAVLNDAVALAEINCVAIIQLKGNLASNHYPVVDAVRRMHSRRVAFKVRCHSGNPLVQFGQIPSVCLWIGLRSLRRLRREHDEPKEGATRFRERTLPCQHGIGFLSGDPRYAVGRVELPPDRITQDTNFHVPRTESFAFSLCAIACPPQRVARIAVAAKMR